MELIPGQLTELVNKYLDGTLTQAKEQLFDNWCTNELSKATYYEDMRDADSLLEEARRLSQMNTNGNNNNSAA